MKKLLILGYQRYECMWVAHKALEKGYAVWGWDFEAPTPTTMLGAILGDKINQLNQQISREILSSSVADFLNEAQPDVVLYAQASEHSKEKLKDLDYHMQNSVHDLEVFLQGVIAASHRPQLILVYCSDRQNGQDPHSQSHLLRLQKIEESRKNIPSLKAVTWGSVIGSFDFREQGLIPQLMTAILQDHVFLIRKPHSVRSFQWVEILAEDLLKAMALELCKPSELPVWNLGPQSQDMHPVLSICLEFARLFGKQHLIQGSRHKSPQGLSFHPSPDTFPFYKWLSGENAHSVSLEVVLKKIAQDYRHYYGLKF
ncbi:MAG: hypothetical protein ACLGGX_05775 [Bdellovibrionia bacterium]